MPLVSLIGIGIVAFVSTNIDDLIVLLMFLCDPKYHTRPVVLGQYLGFLGLVAVSILGALAALLIPHAWIGLLGLIPLLIGLNRLLWRSRADDPALKFAKPWHSQVLTVAAITVANGGDNISLYVPLFATHTPPAVGLLIALFFLLLGVWCYAAHLLINHPLTAGRIRRCSRQVVPLLYIALGLWILGKTLPLIR
jgi:cadmium resistance transport/sequestration family protein